jgi:tetratricopeptide (TPR) repeat protein
MLAEAKALLRAGQLREAEHLYRSILQADPGQVEALYLLAVVCDALHDRGAAAEALERLLELEPNHPQAHNHLGALLAEQGDLEAAIAHFLEAGRLNPDWAEPRDNLTSARVAKHNQQGLQLATEGKLDLAAAAHRAALALRPDDAAAHGNLGNVLKAQGDLAAAAECYRHALRLAPRAAEGHYNLGVLCGEQARWEEAETHLRRAIELAPEDPAAHCELGRVLLEQGNPRQAVGSYRRAVELAPNFADARFHLAFALLLTGAFAEGWREYEWRLAWKGMEGPPLAEPRWAGSPVPDGAILLRCEQGFGDALQFIRYAQAVKQRWGTVIVECRRPLARLLARCAGVDRVVVRGETRPSFDAHAPLLSLPGIFGTVLENIPAEVPYLVPDAALVAHWRAELARDRSFRIGISWQGDPTHANDRNRSFSLAHFRGIAHTRGVRLYSLQMGAGREQLVHVAQAWPIVDLGDHLGDFHDTAAIMRNLDLVITCDSAPAHLAGGLGVPVWVALARAPDWRWLVDRDDSPWYPTMRLFRQERSGQWGEVFERIAAELAGRLA